MTTTQWTQSAGMTSATEVDNITEFAEQSAANAAAALASKVAAEASKVSAAASAVQSSSLASNAATSASASDASKTSAETAETNAETAETNAETAETNASASATTATNQAVISTTKAGEAATSATTATTKASEASTSAATAATQAGISTTKAGESAASAAAALASKNAAATSETNAATSASTATTQASTATTQAGISTTKAGEASASETAAAGSASTASTQAGIATTKAAEAASDAAAAGTSETNAAASAAASAGSATASANSAASAAAALDNFDDRYLGPKSSEPTTDNDGNALISGSLYFSTAQNAMQVFDGANWIAASAAGVASMILYEYTATSGQTTFTGADDNSNSISFIAGNEIVVLNGVILDPSDYNSSSGTSIVLASGAATGDLLNVYAFKSFTVADTVSASAGGTFAGNVTVTGSFTSQGIDDNANATAITIDSSENVGIGTSTSLSDILTVDDTNPKISIRDAGTERAFLEVDSSNNFVLNNKSTSSMIFETSDSERMRIGSSGNVLANTTSNSVVGNGGFAIKPQTGNGTRVDISNAGEAMLLDGAASGPIIGFYGNGTSVGSIGSGSGVMAIAGPTGNGLSFTNNGVLPATSIAGAKDASTDLGVSYSRFKDLYLSGGVYLGGTGSANKLTDYEFGNWTPVLRGSSGTPSGQVYSNQLGTYTKIGRSVHVQAYVSVTNMGSGAGGTYGILTGLPFNVASGPQYYASASFPYVGALGQNVNSLHGYGQHSSDFVYVMYQNGPSIASLYLSPAGWGSTPTIMFGMTYFTDA